ncbi:CD109 antigen-like [Scylla paramamosain]|uniref:CD109 antigen-like n=1 Tax=Scylla paramamosain TaxID=85552 RepID=UPI003083AB25
MQGAVRESMAAVAVVVVVVVLSATTASAQNVAGEQGGQGTRQNRDLVTVPGNVAPRVWRTRPRLQDPKNLPYGTVHAHTLLGRRDPNLVATKSSYTIVAPRIARPSTIYRVAVGILSGSSPVDVTAQLTSPGASLTPAKATIAPGDTEDLLIQVPHTSVIATYTLHVEGRRGHTLVFRNSSQVLSSPTFLTILIQLSRVCFNGGQDVGIKIILLTTELRPYEEPVDVFILDPQDNIIKRWVSRSPRVGIVDVSFTLPDLPQLGWWRVRVRARRQEQEKQFLVHKLYEPLFEVFVGLPYYALSTDEEITGTISGTYTTDKPIYGNASLSVYVKQPWDRPDSDFKYVTTEIFEYVDEEEEFAFPMESLLPHVQQLEGAEVLIECKFYEVFWWIESRGHSRIRILGNEVEVKLVGAEPFVFRPGMPFTGTVAVQHTDKQAIDPSRLEESTLLIKATVSTPSSSFKLPEIIVPPLSEDTETRERAMKTLKDAQWEWLWGGKEAESDTWKYEVMTAENELKELFQDYTKDQYFAEYRSTGIFRFKVDIPKEATKVQFDVTYQDSEANAASTTTALAHHNPGHRYIQVTTSTDEAHVGEFVVLHVRSNFHVHKFIYMILAKGLLLHVSSEVTGGDDVVTFSVAVSSSMSPRFTVVVYAITHDGEVVADSMAVPVSVLNNMKISLALNQHKDHSKRTVEVVAGAPPGSLYTLQCQRGLNYIRQHPNALTRSRILAQMMEMEPVQRTVHGVLQRSRDGSTADRLVPLSAHSYGKDVLAAFQDAALILLTDADLALTPGREGTCDVISGYLECGDGTCFRHHQLCDGVMQCANGADELGCDKLYNDFPPNHKEQEDHLGLTSDTLFRILREHFIEDIFDEEDIEWCNADIWVGHRGQEEIQREVVKTAEEWVVEAYAIHPEFGLAFTHEPIQFLSDPPFYIMVEGPESCRRGEQIAIRVIAYNLVDITLQAVLILHDSDDYMFVNVEEDGNVQHFRPRLSRGQHQHLIIIPPGGLQEVLFPLAVKRQSGTMEVTIEAVTQVMQDSETWEVEVKPEGVPVRKHTSLVLDLRNRAVLYEFLDVPIDESPVIPFSILRRFLYGSPAARISITGDVFGPTPESLMVDHTEVFGGRHLRSTDGVAFNFGATLWTLHYLRLTNQLVTNDAKDAFDYLTVQLAGLLWRNTDGGYSMWANHTQNVWLTAKVTNLLLAAQHEDWENLLYIDPGIIQKSVRFLLQNQMPSGGFAELGEVPLDAKLSSFGRPSSVPLTALVTLVLHNSLPVLQGVTHSRAVAARAKAAKYLVFQLAHLDDVYHLAITAYALTILGSPAADTAAAKLYAMRRQQGDMAYWSKVRITTHLRRQENSQRAFLLPREPEQWDSHAVEASSYGLLVLLTREGVTTNSEQVMRWLNAVRDWDFAFVSTSDTVVAMQALAEYSFRARLRDVTNIECSFEVTSQPVTPLQVTITNESLSTYHSFELENVWGHVNLMAKGSGQAIAQLEASWGVDVLSFIEQPHKKYFELNVWEKYHQFRNKSIITTTVCAKWLATEEGNTSSAALVEVEVPTGYMFLQPHAEERLAAIKMAGHFPELKNVHTTKTHIFWQFDNIPSHSSQCFSYDVRRWYPAANLTAIRSATVMELFSPEHFEMVMINATPLALLDICEVCGSYQCPYCPIYSAAPPLSPPPWLLLLLLFALSLLLSPSHPSRRL